MAQVWDPFDPIASRDARCCPAVFLAAKGTEQVQVPGDDSILRIFLLLFRSSPAFCALNFVVSACTWMVAPGFGIRFEGSIYGFEVSPVRAR